MTHYPEFTFSMADVRRAGEIISGPLNADDPNTPISPWAFHVAHNWRNAHAFPLRSVRQQVGAYISRLQLEGVTAGRLKRMQAIRRKLKRVKLHLHQYQDLAGCRAILKSVEEVRLLKTALEKRSRHQLRKCNDYINEPKSKDGYRSCHLIFSFQGHGESQVFDGRRVEVQLRTQLQHSWATAVEAVGLFRGEDLKGNTGDARWLRLFKLMSAEFALAEGCPEPDGVPGHAARIQEIQALDEELEATPLLDNLSDAVRWVDDAVQGPDVPSYYLITYHRDSYNVEVDPFYDPMRATKAYNEAEDRAKRSANTVVLVEGSKVNQLREAYPNYFGNVQRFKDNLRLVTGGQTARAFSVVPQERVKQLREQVYDPRWLTKRGRWKG